MTWSYFCLFLFGEILIMLNGLLLVVLIDYLFPNVVSWIFKQHIHSFLNSPKLDFADSNN